MVRFEANENERMDTCISTHVNRKLGLPTRVRDHGRDERVGRLELLFPILRTRHRLCIEVNIGEERVRFGTSTERISIDEIRLVGDPTRQYPGCLQTVSRPSEIS